MKLLTFVLALGLFLTFISPVFAGRGCCSYHGGQNYCDTSVGRWVCNDGTYSPTCGCTYIAPTKAPVYLSPPAPTYESIQTTPTPSPTITPTSTPTTAPTNAPMVEGASTTSDGGSVLGGLGIMGVLLFGGYKGLKWLGRVTAPKNEA